jgi:ATP-binding cassette subfamily B protein
MNFAYDENYIIKDFSVVLEKGKKYALLGESGSGKTTFAKVLAGLLDNYSGNVFFDKIELKEIQRHSLFNQITYVDQNVYVFAESIRFNISLGENFSDEEIWEALRKSQLDEFVNSLDGKLEYKLSENGKNLSGGQRQRLALARAFIRNVSFVIIDEGTSALDMKNAMEIENTLMAEPDTGMIIISHSLSEETKKKLDNVISFEEINCV